MTYLFLRVFSRIKKSLVLMSHLEEQFSREQRAVSQASTGRLTEVETKTVWPAQCFHYWVVCLFVSLFC